MPYLKRIHINIRRFAKEKSRIMNPGDASSGTIWLPGVIRFNVLLGKTKRRIFKRSVVVIEMCIGPRDVENIRNYLLPYAA